MERKTIAIDNPRDAAMLLDRIERTLPHLSISSPSPRLTSDDDLVFDGLCRAIFSANAAWQPIIQNWQLIKSALSRLKISSVATLSEGQMSTAYQQLVGPLKEAMKPEDLSKKISYIRDDAKIMLRIARNHGSFCAFLSPFLTTDRLGNSIIAQANEKKVVGLFADPGGDYKLKGVRLAIFCEFCKNIGIDEFKPDRHANRFLHRIEVWGHYGQCDEDWYCRDLGIRLAKAAGQARRRVDNLIFSLCAKSRGEVCGISPECGRCLLRNEEPMLCGYCIHENLTHG